MAVLWYIGEGLGHALATYDHHFSVGQRDSVGEGSRIGHGLKLDDTYRLTRSTSDIDEICRVGRVGRGFGVLVIGGRAPHLLALLTFTH